MHSSAFLPLIHTAYARGYETFSCSTQLSMAIILLINLKMPTIVDILTFINRIDTTSESFKQENRSFTVFQFL